VKLHLLLDHDGYLPTFACISEGKKHDVRVARQLALAPGSIVALDRGYYDFRLFASWIETGVFFVSRLKHNADYLVLQQLPVPDKRNIVADELIVLAGFYAKKKMPAYAAPRSGLGPEQPKADCFVDKSSRFWLQYDCGNLQGSLADRIILQSLKAESENQNLCRHQ
jgi:hypothetical protein